MGNYPTRLVYGNNENKSFLNFTVKNETIKKVGDEISSTLDLTAKDLEHDFAETDDTLGLEEDVILPEKKETLTDTLNLSKEENPLKKTDETISSSLDFSKEQPVDQIIETKETSVGGKRRKRYKNYILSSNEKIVGGGNDLESISSLGLTTEGFNETAMDKINNEKMIGGKPLILSSSSSDKQIGGCNCGTPVVVGGCGCDKPKVGGCGCDKPKVVKGGCSCNELESPQPIRYDTLVTNEKFKGGSKSDSDDSTKKDKDEDENKDEDKDEDKDEEDEDKDEDKEEDKDNDEDKEEEKDEDKEEEKKDKKDKKDKKEKKSNSENEDNEEDEDEDEDEDEEEEEEEEVSTGGSYVSTTNSNTVNVVPFYSSDSLDYFVEVNKKKKKNK